MNVKGYVIKCWKQRSRKYSSYYTKWLSIGPDLGTPTPILGISWWLGGKEFACQCRGQVRFLGQEDPLEKEMTTYSSTFAWEIPWTEEPGRLQSMGSQRVRHNWATKDIFGCHDWREGITSIKRVRDRNTAKYLTMQRTAPHHRELSDLKCQ